MRILKGIAAAFSRYSRIPMPYFEYDGEVMKYNLVFLPLIGMVTGFLSYGVYALFNILNTPVMAGVCLLSFIPLAVTGGFHLDGFMDVSDALSSYADREKKLDILKDPHIGAFAVVRLLKFALLWVAALYVIVSELNGGYVLFFCGGFFVSRVIGAMLSMTMKKAKSTGMLSEETGASDKAGLIILFTELVIGAVYMFFTKPVCAAIAAAGLIVYTLAFIKKMYREFGGMTGDTAGYYICMAELVIALSDALGIIACRMISV